MSLFIKHSLEDWAKDKCIAQLPLTIVTLKPFMGSAPGPFLRVKTPVTSTLDLVPLI